MTQDEIIRMAREAGVLAPEGHNGGWYYGHDNLERFAALVAAHEREKAKAVLEELEREVKAELINAINGAVELEREACAKLMDAMAAQDNVTNYYKVAANAIRARSKIRGEK